MRAELGGEKVERSSSVVQVELIERTVVPSRSRSVPEKTTGHTKDGGEREKERDEGRREKKQKKEKTG